MTDERVVLLVEDEKLVRNLVERYLGSLGYSVLAAQDGKDALRLLAEREVEIYAIVTDVVMPDISGPDLVDRIGPKLGWPLVIFMSGYTDTEVRLSGGRTEFLSKPFALPVLAEILNRTFTTA
jgi:two-component system cell cycle sensor histidine kinase/response regulator CckA